MSEVILLGFLLPGTGNVVGWTGGSTHQGRGHANCIDETALLVLLPVQGSACRDNLRKSSWFCDVGRQDVGAWFPAGQRMQALIASVVLAVACLNSYRLPFSNRLSSCLRLAHAGK
jgi:hypothetical protein